LRKPKQSDICGLRWGRSSKYIFSKYTVGPEYSF